MFKYTLLIPLLIIFAIGAEGGAFLHSQPQKETAKHSKELQHSDNVLLDNKIEDIGAFVQENIRENHVFYGLASYYNNVNHYIVSNEELVYFEEGASITLKQHQWLAAVGRFNVLLIKVNGLTVHLLDTGMVINNPSLLYRPDAVVKSVTKPELPEVASDLNDIRYAHLWAPFASLAKLIEMSLVSIQRNISSSWGVTLVIFTVLLKIILLPFGMLTVRFQRSVSQVQAKLAPQLADIKKNYNGEEAHDRLMAAHKRMGVTPFYSLKPMLGTFFQIPVLIATFNALGEMPQFAGQSFLWIKDLAYPDAIASLRFSIPIFGDTINLLPFVMTAVTLFSTAIFKNPHAPGAEVQFQKRNLYLMSAAFFVLFYPFPAVMVLFWALANILHTFQQQIIKI